jgi:hypothetical protein
MTGVSAVKHCKTAIARSTALTVDSDSPPPDFAERRDSRTGLFALGDEAAFLGLRFTDGHRLLGFLCIGRLSLGQTAACAARAVSLRFLKAPRIAFEWFFALRSRSLALTPRIQPPSLHRENDVHAMDTAPDRQS